MKKLCIAVTLLVITATGVASQAPTRAALDLIRGMNATNAGVDRHGHFWFWDAVDLSVTTVSPEGESATIDLDPDVRAIDVDRERGVLTLARDSRNVRITSFSGAIVAAFELPFNAANVCWMDGNQIGIASSMSAWSVEVWNTFEKAVIRRMGPVPEIKVPSAGAVLTRVPLLRYDTKRQLLVTLDAFGGELVVFDRSGKIVRRGKITSPELAANLTWLRELDERSKRNRNSQTPSFWNYVRMSLSPDGTVWLGEKSDTPGAVTVAKILPDGRVRRNIVNVPSCPSARFELWGEQVVFFRSSRSTQRCVAMKEMKP